MKKVLLNVFMVVMNFLIFYLLLPTLSIHNRFLWILTIINIGAFYFINNYEKIAKAKSFREVKKAPLYAIAVLIAAILAGDLFSSQMFNAKAYSKLLNISVSDHVALPGVNDLEKIPLMDTESSKVLGNRKIGALSMIVSQFEVSDSYMTISYKNQPVKVSGLYYAGFWKWIANKATGVPGYVMVYPNELTAEYVELKEGMKYVPSAYFLQDLARHIYFKYPTVFFENLHFEIDESGQPYYVASTYEKSIGLFGGKKINGCIVANPVTGEVQKYDLNNIPDWVDIVYYGDYVSKYFDIYGKLLNGFWNSWFGQKGLIESTTTTIYNSDGESSRLHDFGYIVRNDDVYIYTGVTAVTNDESNIGYLLANERTGELVVSYFEATDEDSVMRAAEGEVQEKKYRASFPSLIELNDTPVYVMVLKDNLGLVKMYAVVDANQYSHMVVADTLNKALSLFSTGSINTDASVEKTIVIRKIELITSSGETMVYIVDTENNVYYSGFESQLLLLEAGQSIVIETDGTVFRIKK